MDTLSPPASITAPATDWAARVETISLLRAPASDAATAFTAHIADLTAPHLGRSRTLGTAGIASHRRQTGIILAGLLKGGLRGDPVRARQGKARPWRPSAIGQDLFWRQIAAMEAVGLVLVRDGVPFVRRGVFTGKPAGIECSAGLLHSAAAAGITRQTFSTDFPLTLRAQTQRPTIAREDLLTFVAVPERDEDGRTRIPTPAGQQTNAAAALERLERLNAHLATATTTGCVPPVLRRQFFGSLALGGRFTAIGEDTFQNLRRADRHLLSLNGDPVVEVDLRAALLSIFLALTDCPIPADPYSHGALVGFDRDAVKAWFIQTLHQGRPAAGWSPKTLDAIRLVPIKPIAAAAMQTYPTLAAMSALLPDAIVAELPLGRAAWALGQWLTGWESAVMDRTLEKLTDAGVIALPLHDALLVRQEDVVAARRSLVESFEERLGVRPRVKIKGACSES